VNNTFISNSVNIFKVFNENINLSKNVRSDIKSSLIKCAAELMEIIKLQNELIIKQKYEYFSGLKTHNDRHIEILNDTNKQLFEMKNHKPVKLYSNVVKSGEDMQLENKQKHLIIIKPEDNKTSKQTEDIIKKYIKPNDIKIGVKCQLLSEEIEKKQLNLKVNKPTKKKQTIVLRNVSPDIPEPDLINSLIENNIQINNYFANQNKDITDELKIKFKFRKKSPKYDDNYCLEVSPEVRKIMFRSGRIFIGWKACKIEDSLPVIRCFKCHGFGHKSGECKLEDEHCGHCGDRHKSSECTSDRSQYSCVNCIKHNAKPNQRNKFETNHSSYNRSCPSFSRIKEIVKTRINYE
jgi:hypothetical protein